MASKDATVTSASFDEFNTQLQGSALKTTRNSMLLPADIAWHRSMDSEFAQELDVFSSRVLSLTNKLLTLAGTVGPSGKGKGRLVDEDDMADNFNSLVVDSMDHLLEKTDLCLDDVLGVGRNKAPAIAINPKAAPVKKKSLAPNGRLDAVIQHAAHLPKPQLSFKTKADNSNTPWKPQLAHKYNAQVPLGYQYQDDNEEGAPEGIMKLHPYRYEITHTNYPSDMFEQATPINPEPFDSTTFRWVDTAAELTAMIDELRKAKEIAVDLEHHSYRSYDGFLCLMQISTRTQDWIVDLLALREEMEVLNEVFTDPKIVKVFHGAESDIVWLQQDLNLYIVNLFDTFHASKILGFPRHGLANLLEMYCDFTPDKRYQLADWRIRPLPEAMLDYARSDTHFLLYIYDNLRNALLDRALSLSTSDDANSIASSSKTDPLHVLVREVLKRSEETALRVYEKEIYDAENGTGSSGWDTLARKWNKAGLYNTASTAGIPGMQKEVYRRVHSWRDAIAREEDESTRYVLPNQFIFQLAEQPPAEMATLLRVFYSVPPVIRRRARELLDTIREAVAAQLRGEAPATAATAKPPTQTEVQQWSKEVVMSDSTSANTAQNNIWTQATTSSLASPRSFLFAKTTPLPTPIAAKTSILFGKSSSKPNTPTPQQTFRDVISRIHSTLVIAPSAVKVPTQYTNEPTIMAMVVDEEPVSPSTVQPQAAASQRATIETVEDDSIVVVGQARQKKRKRKAAGTDGEPANNSDARMSKRAAVEGVQEPFDFNSIPNVLDEPTPAADPVPNKKKGKAKQSKDKAFYGNFPAPPKANSELKSANKSHTFK